MLKLQSAVLLLAMLALAMARATSHRGQMHRGPDINARSGPGLAIRRSPLINQPEKAKVQWEEGMLSTELIEVEDNVIFM